MKYFPCRLNHQTDQEDEPRDRESLPDLKEGFVATTERFDEGEGEEG